MSWFRKCLSSLIFVNEINFISICTYALLHLFCFTFRLFQENFEALRHIEIYDFATAFIGPFILICVAQPSRRECLNRLIDKVLVIWQQLCDIVAHTNSIKSCPSKHTLIGYHACFIYAYTFICKYICAYVSTLGIEHVRLWKKWMHLRLFIRTCLFWANWR